MNITWYFSSLFSVFCSSANISVVSLRCSGTASLLIQIFLLLLVTNSVEAIEKVSEIFSIFIRQYYLDTIH